MLIFWATVLAVTLVLLAASWLSDSKVGQRIHDRAARVRFRHKQKRATAPVVYPITFKVALSRTDGSRRAASIEVTREVIRVWDKGHTGLLARIEIEDITSVLYDDRLKQGVSLAGIAINTMAGGYHFMREGIMAAFQMQKAAEVVWLAHKQLTGRDLPAIRVEPSMVWPTTTGSGQMR